MAEYEIKLGRTLVSVNMGQGFRDYDDPKMAASFIKSLGRVFPDMTQRLFREVEPQSDVSLAQSWETAQLEAAWLIGDEERVRRILNG